jgi:AcrR family transcriptional regulator
VQPVDASVKSEPDRRRTRWDRHRVERRAELVAAAAEAIVQFGPDVDMAQVAAIAGVSKPVLYRYFADKAQLWTAVGERMAQIVVDAVAPAIAKVGAERELVATTIDAYLAVIETQPDLYRFLMHQAGSAPGLPHVFASSTRTVATSLARVIGDRLRAVGLDAGGAEPWAYGMVGLAQSVADWWIVHSRPMSRAALTEYLTTLLWDGLSGIRAAADIPGGLSAHSGHSGRVVP